MEKWEFSIDIDAPRRKVWEVLWGDDSYPQWTRVFSEGSTAKTDWQEGSKVHFLDGKGSGMYSRIERRVDDELMSIRHLGEIRDGQELPAENAVSEGWANAMEAYQLAERDGGTSLRVSLDGTAEHKDYFSKTFPKALEEVKRLAEQ